MRGSCFFAPSISTPADSTHHHLLLGVSEWNQLKTSPEPAGHPPCTHGCLLLKSTAFSSHANWSSLNSVIPKGCLCSPPPRLRSGCTLRRRLLVLRRYKVVTSVWWAVILCAHQLSWNYFINPSLLEHITGFNGSLFLIEFQNYM